MKKTFLAAAVLLGAAVCVSSCSNEDYEEQLYDGTAVAGTVGAAQPVSHDLRTHVVAIRTRADRDHIGAFNVQPYAAINAFMKICGPDINGGSSSKAYEEIDASKLNDLKAHMVAAAGKDANDGKADDVAK